MACADNLPSAIDRITDADAVASAGRAGMQASGRLSQEQIVFGLALLLCLVFAVALPGFLTTEQPAEPRPQRLHPRHPRRGDGPGRDRPRHRSVAGRADGRVGGVDAAPDRERHASAAGARHRPRLQPLHRRGQRMARRLCRDTGDLRDACHGHAGLRLRPLLPVRSGRRLHARNGATSSCGSGRARCSAFPSRSSSSPASASAAISSCATRSRAAICAPSATISSPRGSPAFRRARSSSCNTCCRR